MVEACGGSSGSGVGEVVVVVEVVVVKEYW